MKNFFHRIFKNIFWRFKFLHHWIVFNRLSKGGKKRFKLSLRNWFPVFFEDSGESSFDRHYVYHTAWAARKLSASKPSIHYDISSSIFFVGISSAFIPIRFFDFRPPKLTLSNLQIESADLCKLQFESNSIESLSCMHSIEHIGLGRYGDSLDPDGDLKAIKELKRVLKRGGRLLLVVPIGKPVLKFNAHRVYSYRQIIDEFDGFELSDFTLIQDSKGQATGPVNNATEYLADLESYGCGCFEFIKEVN